MKNGTVAKEVTLAEVLSESGYTPAYFKQTLREDLVLNQLRAGLSGSEFATPLELQLSARVLGEQRDVRYVVIPVENFVALQMRIWPQTCMKLLRR